MTLTLVGSLLLASPLSDEAVLLLDLEPVGVEAELTRGVSASLAEALETKLGRPPLTLPTQSADGTSACKEGSDCIKRLAGLVDAGTVLSGSLGRVGGELVLSLSLLDTDRSLPLGRGAVTASTATNLQAELPALLARVFGDGAPPSVSRLELRPRPAFVVLDFTTAGIDESAIQSLTQVVASEAKRLDAASVVAREDINALLETEQLRSALRAECDRSCFSEIAGALDADYLIVGHAALLAGNYVASLSLLDQQDLDSAVNHRVTETFRGDEKELLGAVRHATRRLLGLPPSEGGLTVSANSDEVSVFLDGTLLGELPMPPKLGIAGGRHTIRLEKRGYFDWQRDVYVSGGQTTPVWAELQAEPTLWYEQWWVWTIAGAVVVGATVAAVLLTRPNDTGRIGFTFE